jgi:hypothetical protein
MFHNGFGLWGIIVMVIAVVPFWRLCTRIGFSPWLSLLIIVPLANIIFIYYLAFSEWPTSRGTAAPGGAAPATG